MKSDNDIWKESLTNEENVDLFKTEDGGKNAKPLPVKKVFKTKEEIKMEATIKELERNVKLLIKEVRSLKVRLKTAERNIKIIKNKKQQPQPKIQP